MMGNRSCAAPVNNRGVALITALLIVALATTAAVTMVSRQQLDIRRTGNILQMEKNYLLVQRAEDIAAHFLRFDVQNNNIDIEADWAVLEGQKIDLEDGAKVSGTLTDMQGRFNINSMVNSNATIAGQALQQFRNLLDAINQDPLLANAVVDWIDGDSNGTPVGSEPNYFGKDPAYLAANQPMFSRSELLLVDGFNTAIYEQLKGYVSTLSPSVYQINVNTVSAEVLRSLAIGISPNDPLAIRAANDLINARGTGGFADVPAVIANSASATLGLTAGGLSVDSHYFMVNSTIEVEQTELEMHSLLYRNDTNIEALARAQGKY